MYCFTSLESIVPNYVRKPYFWTIISINTFPLGELKCSSLLPCPFSDIIHDLESYIELLLYLLIQHSPWSLQAVGHLVPEAIPQPGHGHFLQHSGVG